MYAIIDLETTGTSAAFGKVIEIAAFIHNGNEVTDSFVTLINPECNIPWNITRLTGISNEMVAEAPKFYEVAKHFVELTAGRIFVAHNAMFDYSFIKEEFKRLGYDYRRKVLCTVKLARRLIPGHRSYSLGNICADLKIDISGRHRAAGDAYATVKLLELLLKQISESGSNLFSSPSYALSSEKIASLPGTPGVYYFIDNRNTIIYIGKSNDIHQRVLSHLGNAKTKRAIEMRNQIADVSWEETGSELIALLLESSEIKKHKPLFNRLQRRSAHNYGLFFNEDENGYINLEIKKIKEDEIPLTTFHFQKEGLDFIHYLADKYRLCKKLCHLDSISGACFNAQINSCNGACTGQENPDSYNLRAKNAISSFQYRSPDFFIIEKGRSNEELAVVKIEKGKYIGFGFVNLDSGANNLETLHDCIKPYTDNRDTQSIIHGYLIRKRGLKIVKYSTSNLNIPVQIQ
jgi:DNA polymerase III subunit epsilon